MSFNQDSKCFIDTDYLGISADIECPDAGHTESMDSVMHELDSLLDAGKESAGKTVFIIDSIGGLK